MLGGNTHWKEEALKASLGKLVEKAEMNQKGIKLGN
jgi:hypothetical protein